LALITGAKRRLRRNNGVGMHWQRHVPNDDPEFARVNQLFSDFAERCALKLSAEGALIIRELDHCNWGVLRSECKLSTVLELS
jgi:hypothetical protein